jgi:predicted ATPase/DNA-binding SARP family transcriptional activator
LANLRQALVRLRAALEQGASGAPCLRVGREMIALDPACGLWVDVAVLHDTLAAIAQHIHRDAQTCPQCSASREAAFQLYKGDFLEDLDLPDSDLFDEWASAWRARLRAEILDAYRRQADYCALRDDWPALHKCAARLVQLEPYDEPAHCQLMRALARDGRPGEALAHYDALVKTLGDELDAEPSVETRLLAQRIRSGAEQSEKSRVPFKVIPTPLTPLIGRSVELAELRNWLVGSSRRLITLTGVGGIGKTRLAIAAAQDVHSAFPDGVLFVDLARSGVSRSLSAAVAQAAGSAPGASTQSVFDDLERRNLLLVLDGFEPLMASRGALAQLLLQGPGLVALVTSRERLGLSGECIFGVGGLEVPPRFMVDAMEEYSAVQLFRESARRVLPEFALTPDNRDAVLEICQLVEGLPLAIDLAAAWVRALSCREIADEIRRSYDFLSITKPEDSSGMRAAFDSSWNRLDGREQRVLARLSVFRAGFDRQGAAVVAGADVATLAGLIDKSLVRALADNRYDLHDLIAYYCRDRLAEIGGTAEAERAHADYFASAVLERGDWTNPVQVLRTFFWLCREYADLEAALQWSSSGDPPNNPAAARRLLDFINHGGHGWGVHLMEPPTRSA